MSCERCADPTTYGDLEQLASDPQRHSLLLRCPDCGSLDELHPEERRPARDLTPREARLLYPGPWRGLGAPVDRADLVAHLDAARVPTDAYSLTGELHDDALILDHVGHEWVVFYYERGSRSGERRFGSESEANDHVLRTLLRDHPSTPDRTRDRPDVDTLAGLEQHLADERALPPGQRSTAADDASLDGVLSLVARARASYAAGHHGVAVDLLAQAAYVAGDSWSHASPVGAEVLAVHRALASKS